MVGVKIVALQVIFLADFTFLCQSSVLLLMSTCNLFIKVKTKKQKNKTKQNTHVASKNAKKTIHIFLSWPGMWGTQVGRPGEGLRERGVPELPEGKGGLLVRD